MGIQKTDIYNIKVKAVTDKNPSGIEHKIQLHYEHEKKGKFIVVPDVKPPPR